MNKNFRQVLYWYKDALVSALIMLIFAGFLFYASKIRVLISSGVTARFFPTVICIIAIFLCIINLVAGLSHGNKLKKHDIEHSVFLEDKTKEEKITSLKVFLSIVLIVVYLILVKIVGFLPASIVYLFVQMTILTNELTKKKYILFAIISIVSSFAFYFFFRTVFNLLLPRGIMPF